MHVNAETKCTRTYVVVSLVGEEYYLHGRSTDAHEVCMCTVHVHQISKAECNKDATGLYRAEVPYVKAT